MNHLKTSTYPLVIIGAGAAGIGASKRATELGIDHLVIEASHRIGGRGLTEYLEDSIPVDLGCHWMHCASKNPFVQVADQLGFSYESGSGYAYAMLSNGSWMSEEDKAQYAAYSNASYEAMDVLYEKDPAAAMVEAIDLESRWSNHFCYWMSLMHSNDVDQVAIQDHGEFEEINEDWPVKEGYGALIARHGENCPIQLNNQVTRIDWGGTEVRLETTNGTLTADHVIVTVSTGVLGAGVIEFTPELPATKIEAITALPMGNSNYTIFSLDESKIDPDTPKNIHYEKGEINMAIRIRPFGHASAFASTGGRFAWWLEKQGSEASRQYFEEALVDVLGSEGRKALREFKVSAWGFDPWIRGAYSSQKPGSRDMRKRLAEPLDERLYFAGEATSGNFLNTAHGAYISGGRAVNEVMDL